MNDQRKKLRLLQGSYKRWRQRYFGSVGERLLDVFEIGSSDMAGKTRRKHKTEIMREIAGRSREKVIPSDGVDREGEEASPRTLSETLSWKIPLFLAISTTLHSTLH
jgi:hypothetical protein